MAKSQAEMLIEQEKTRKDPAMEMKETIMLPRIPGDEQNYVNVGVNGIMFQVQRGKRIEVPVAVAEVLKHSEAMSVTADDYLEKAVKKFQ